MFTLFAKWQIDETESHGYAPTNNTPPSHLARFESMTIEQIMDMAMVKELYKNPPKNGYVNPVTMIIPMLNQFGKAIIAREKIGSTIHTIYVKPTPTQNRPVYRDSDGDWIEDYLDADEYGNAQIDWTNRGNFDEDDYGNVMLLLP